MNPILREARSSPYIDSQTSDGSIGNGSSGIGPKLQSAVSNECFGKAREIFFNSVQFNAGSSSSSELLESLGNMERQWATEGQKQSDGNSLQQQRTERNTKAESADNLVEYKPSEHSCSITGPDEISEHSPEASNNFLGKQRSETNLPGKTARESGFRLLEKCCSVELSPGKIMSQPSKLARSKEMPNIADVDDYELYDE